MAVLYLAQQLNQLNRDFYQTVAESFSATREQPWSGWQWLAEADRQTVSNAASVADVGCGNGRFGSFIAPLLASPQEYLGIDSNQQLLQNAYDHVGYLFKKVSLIQSDIVQEDLAEKLAMSNPDIIAVFGVFHHLPTQVSRRQFLQSLKEIIGDDESKSIWLSTWQFTGNKNLMERAVSPKEIGFTITEDDEWTENDYILDWRRDKKAYRYCHLTTTDEMTDLCEQVGLTIVATHQSSNPGDKDNRYYSLKSGV